MIELKEHNQETYQHLLEMLQTEDRVACVQPTGTGKSYIALRYIEEHSLKKILLLAPTDIILSQFRETVREIEDEVFEKFFFKNVKTAKYLDLGLEGFKDVFDVKWDTIIMDEFHRSGATTWNQFIKQLLKENPNAKIIGLSATPIRFLDKGRDMGLEFFKNNYACYITLKQALERGILPKPIFVCTDYRITTETSQYIRETYKYVHDKEQEKKIARRFLENGSGMHKILKKHLPNNQGKYIVFCQNSKQIKKMKPIMKAWLDPFNNDIHMYTTLSRDAEPDQPLLDFKYDQSEAIKLLFCVDRLNEGLHLSHLDGEFMLRGTDSPIIYFQQMGRVLTSSQEKRPVVFDLVNNFRTVRATIRRIANQEEKEASATKGQKRGSYTSYLAKEFDEMIKFKMFDEGRNFNEVVDELSINIREERWDQMFNLVKQYYKETGEWPNRKVVFKKEKIGVWLRAQKDNFNSGKLSLFRIKKMNDVDSTLLIPLYETKWLNYYNLVKAIKLSENRWPKYGKSELETNLAKWIYKQRSKYGKGELSNEKIKKLESIGFKWHAYNSMNDDYENYKFNLLIKFININGREPNHRETFKDVPIGQFLYHKRMKFQQGELDDSWIKKFNIANISLIKKRDFNHKKLIDLFKKYKKEYGKLPIERNIVYQGVALGIKINAIRQNYKKGTLKKEYIDDYIELGVLDDFTLSGKSRIDYKIDLLKTYYSLYNTLPTNCNRKFRGIDLYEFCCRLRGDYKNGKLSKEKIETLTNLSPSFFDTINEKQEKRWNEMYRTFSEFYQMNNRLPTKYTDFNYKKNKTWLSRQKKLFKEKKLQKDRQEKLEAIGVVFDKEKKKNKE